MRSKSCLEQACMWSSPPMKSSSKDAPACGLSTRRHVSSLNRVPQSERDGASFVTLCKRCKAARHDTRTTSSSQNGAAHELRSPQENSPPTLLKGHRQKRGRTFTSLSANIGPNYGHERVVGYIRDCALMAKDPMWRMISSVIKIYRDTLPRTPHA